MENKYLKELFGESLGVSLYFTIISVLALKGLDNLLYNMNIFKSFIWAVLGVFVVFYPTGRMIYYMIKRKKKDEEEDK